MPSTFQGFLESLLQCGHCDSSLRISCFRIEFLKTDLEATANTGKKSSALKSDVGSQFSDTTIFQGVKLTRPELKKAEWNFFKTLHHLLPPKTAPIALEPQYEGRNHESTVAIKSGHLERKKRFSQNWKKGSSSFSPLCITYKS